MIRAESMEELLVKVKDMKDRDGEKGPTREHGEGVLIMCEEYDATCSKDLCHEGGYTELSPA